MRRNSLTSLAFLLLLSLLFACLSRAQTADVTASLREVRIEGQKHLSEAQIVAITGLVLGSEVGRADLQAGADKLVQTGLFDKVSYHFETRTGVVVTTTLKNLRGFRPILTTFRGLRIPNSTTPFARNFLSSMERCRRAAAPSIKRRRQSRD